MKLATKPAEPAPESAAEDSPTATYEEPPERDVDYYYKVSAFIYPKEFACDYRPLRDLSPFELPGYEDIKEIGVLGIHLGDYIFWDAERQTEFLRDHYGWSEDNVEGTYKCYKSVECRMPGVHDYTKFLKRGYGRATDHVAQDRRAGLVTRKEGNHLIREFDPRKPEILEYFLKITGYSEQEFYEIMDRHREKVGILDGKEIADALEDFDANHGDRRQERPDERSE